MIQLLIIADDFTGALDTGVQLASYGARTRVITNPSAGFDSYSDNTDVLVADAKTRHLSAQEAYEAVRDIAARAAKIGITHLYKKTDSALRGNIGAELQALMDGAGEKAIAFLPAFPQIGRNTVDGIHYIEGVPVADSIFGRESFEPVRHSSVTELMHEQYNGAVHSASAACPSMPEEGITVFDASSQRELERIGTALSEAGRLRITAGCAGFGAVLPRLLGWRQKKNAPLPRLSERLLVVSGSVNPITIEQLDSAESAGFARYHLTPEQKLDASFWMQPSGAELIARYRQRLEAHPRMIIDVTSPDEARRISSSTGLRSTGAEDARLSILKAISRIVTGILDSPALGTLMITGGDTLRQCMDEMGIYEMEPICEMTPGVVLSSFTASGAVRYVISKSGGFGKTNIIMELMDMIEKNNNR